MKTLLIVDLSNTLHRSLAVNRELQHNGMPTGGVYGLVTQVVARVHEYSPHAFLVCADTRPYIRKQMFSDYKGNRSKNRTQEEKEEFYATLAYNLEKSREFFGLLEVPVWGIKGLEADDLIAHAVELFGKDYERTVILSNDKDLYQLLDKGNLWLHKDKKLYGKEHFQEQYGLRPHQWTDYVAMVGSHNDVPGIKGVGPKTATAALKDSNLMVKMMEKHGEIIERNRRLIRLPLREGPTVRKPTLSVPSFDLRTMAVFLDSLGIQLTTRMREALEEYD